MKRKTTRSYAGRQLDIELLDHVGRMLPSQRVWPDIHGGVRPDDAMAAQRIVSGIEKAVQRYAKLFLTHLGSVKSDPDVGSTLLHEVRTGQVTDTAYLDHLCSVASVSALSAMQADDSDGSFGEMPDDEAVVSAELGEMSLDFSTGTAHVKVTLGTRAGEDFEFTIPVESGIGA